MHPTLCVVCLLDNRQLMRLNFYMKTIFGYIAAMVAVAVGAPSVDAQYYEIANQVPGLLRPALSGSLNYKGYVETSYLKGVGDKNVDFLSFSTSQGFRYSSWFFMGVGIGADVLFSHVDDDFGNWINPDLSYLEHGSTATGVMIPLFTDFRFNIGGQSSVSFFIDIKTGCSFLIGKDYLRVGNGYLTSNEYFYLRPSIGVRIPVSENGRQAVNVGVDYQLLTSDYWNSYSRSTTIHAIGGVISYEW